MFREKVRWLVLLHLMACLIVEIEHCADSDDSNDPVFDDVGVGRGTNNGGTPATIPNVALDHPVQLLVTAGTRSPVHLV